MATDKNFRQRSFRFNESVYEWFNQRDLKMQGIVTRLVDKFIQEKETEEKKIQGYQK